MPRQSESQNTSNAGSGEDPWHCTDGRYREALAEPAPRHGPARQRHSHPRHRRFASPTSGICKLNTVIAAAQQGREQGKGSGHAGNCTENASSALALLPKCTSDGSKTQGEVSHLSPEAKIKTGKGRSAEQGLHLPAPGSHTSPQSCKAQTGEEEELLFTRV